MTSQESKVIAVPTLIDFTNDRNESVQVSVKKVQCGNTFTVCMTGTLKKKKKDRKREENIQEKKERCIPEIYFFFFTCNR